MKRYALVCALVGSLLALGDVVEGYAIVAFALMFYLFTDDGSPV